MTIQLHPQASQILQRLQQNGISAFYHFTCVENLPGIRDMNALCSKARLELAERWPVPAPGGNKLSHDLDRRNNNWDKISLNFTPHTPMVYHKKQGCHLCFFVIDPSIAARKGVVFTDTNAARTGGQKRAEGLAGIGLVNFLAIHSMPRPGDREGWVKPVQAEVLIPDKIELNQVKELAFVSKASLEEANRLWGNYSHPSFAVQPTYFSDMPASVVLNFSYLENILLTDETVDKNTLNNSRQHMVHFSRRASNRITIVSKVHVTAGESAVTIWHPIEHKQIEEFEKSSDYFYWPSFPIKDLPNGLCSVEYRLGNVRWASLEFRVC